ncbi:MAG: GHKL domain-containing protein [Clostridia bacterium]|nr:GHKL domain-containing protein [Clostridia bacterium]
MVLIFFADLLAAVLISACGISYQMVGSDNITYIVGAMLSDFIRLWLAAYVSKFLTRKVQNLPVSYWIFLVLCPLISIACLLIFDFYLMQVREANEALIFLFPAGILYINLMLFRFFEAFSDKIRLKVMEKLAEQEQENYKVLQQNEDELRALRHDIKNHALMLREYLEHGNTETALTHLRDLEKTFVRVSSVVYTSNPAMDAALNIGARKAQAEGILYKVQIRGAGEIQMDSVDLCSFLSNAIDNAIEGCAGCTEKYIYIEIVFADTNVKIHIENSTCKPNKKTGFLTTKGDKKNHGFGMRNIKSVVNKYHGFLEYEIKNSVFYLDAFFKN